MSVLRRARKLLPHRRCGKGSGHDPHVWKDTASDSPTWGDHFFCEGIAMSKHERKVSNLIADWEAG